LIPSNTRLAARTRLAVIMQRAANSGSACGVFG
jgi:hypothetical protein